MFFNFLGKLFWFVVFFVDAAGDHFFGIFGGILFHHVLEGNRLHGLHRFRGLFGNGRVDRGLFDRGRRFDDGVREGAV